MASASATAATFTYNLFSLGDNNNLGTPTTTIDPTSPDGPELEATAFKNVTADTLGILNSNNNGLSLATADSK